MMALSRLKNETELQINTYPKKFLLGLMLRMTISNPETYMGAY